MASFVEYFNKVLGRDKGESRTRSAGKYRDLPAGHTTDVIDIAGQDVEELRADVHARRISARGSRVRRVQPGIRCDELDLADTPLEELPADLHVRYRLDLSGCQALERLSSLQTGRLVLDGCVGLRELPDRIRVRFLDMSDCLHVRALPDDLRVEGGRLRVRNCVGLRELPAGLGPLSQLDLAGCTQLARLPQTLRVRAWIDVAGTALEGLPPGARDAQLRWRGVPVSHRIAFEPGSITVAEVLEESNAERRRVLLERVGFERFLTEAEATCLDRDRDPGGERKLLRVELEGDEPLVCLSLHCPSTGRHYLIRVPPTIGSCHQGAAWLAGFDDPADYAPLIET